MPGLGRTTDDNCNLSSAGNHGDRTIPGFGGRRNCMSDGYGLRVPQTAASGPVSRPGLTWSTAAAAAATRHTAQRTVRVRAHIHACVYVFLHLRRRFVCLCQGVCRSAPTTLPGGATRMDQVRGPARPPSSPSCFTPRKIAQGRAR